MVLVRHESERYVSKVGWSVVVLYRNLAYRRGFCYGSLSVGDLGRKYAVTIGRADKPRKGSIRAAPEGLG